MGTWSPAGVMKAGAGQQGASPGSSELCQAQTQRRYVTLALTGQSVYWWPVRWP